MVTRWFHNPRHMRVRAPFLQSEYQLVEEAIFQAGYRIIKKPPHALVAQLVEHAPCKREVQGSNPCGSFKDTYGNVFLFDGQFRGKTSGGKPEDRAFESPSTDKRVSCRNDKAYTANYFGKKIVCKTKLKRFKSLNMPCKIFKTHTAILSFSAIFQSKGDRELRCVLFLGSWCNWQHTDLQNRLMGVRISQILLCRFRGRGGIGRRTGLKIPRTKVREGSTPSAPIL